MGCGRLSADTRALCNLIWQEIPLVNCGNRNGPQPHSFHSAEAWYTKGNFLGENIMDTEIGKLQIGDSGWTMPSAIRMTLTDRYGTADDIPILQQREELHT